VPEGYRVCLAVFNAPKPQRDSDSYTRDYFIGIVTEAPPEYSPSGRAMCPMSYVPSFPFSPWQMEPNYLVIQADLGDVEAIVFEKKLPDNLLDILRRGMEAQP